MRRLSLILLCGLVAVPAALAAARAPGDGVLELSAVDAVVTVNGTRGTLWGQMDKGKLVVTDPVAGDGQILVSGAEVTRPGPTENVTIYAGKDIHLRVAGGKYKLYFKGSGIDFTAVGVGSAQLSGDVFSDSPGSYSIDGANWIPVPYSPHVVKFGVPPSSVGGPASTP